MVETAAYLNDHVLPRLQVRQWVLSVPKRLRYFMQRDGAVLIARIYEMFPLLCPKCGGQMHIIAFITHSAQIR